MRINVPFRLLKIEGNGFHLLLAVKINNKAARMIIDTGASSTVFDKTRIAKLLQGEEVADNEQLSTGLGTNSMLSQRVEIKKLKIGALELKKYPAIVLDLNHVNQTYQQLGLPEVEGVLGSDVFHNYKAVIDFAKKIISLEIPKQKKTAKKKTVTAAKKKIGKAKKVKNKKVVVVSTKKKVAAKKAVKKKVLSSKR
ncbi:MAG: retropepsin-like aspartic protease [Bacteroidia bacterium]